MKKSMNSEKQVHLPAELLVKARERARSLGLTLSAYLQALVDNDVRTKEHDPWRAPIPREVDEQWEQDIAAFDEQEKTTPRPRAKTVNEFRTLLKQEAALLPDDEGH